MKKGSSNNNSIKPSNNESNIINASYNNMNYTDSNNVELNNNRMN